jgi:glycolate oxidase
MSQRSAKSIVGEIGRTIGTRKIATSPEMLTCYAFDATNIRHLPFAVTFPETTEDVQSIVTLCGEAGLPVVPRGAGTGFAGGTIPLWGGVVVSTERLNRIHKIDRESNLAVVEPGVVNAALQAEAAKAGLMFPPDPSSLEVCTLGGNVAQDAGGPRALKYGVTRDYVLGVEAVLYDGRVVGCGDGGIAAARWDPVSTLLVGSEGTLAVLTRIYLRLRARPESFATALAFFETTRDAAAAVNLIFACGVLPAALELIDSETMDSIASFIEIETPRSAGCSLLIETDGKRDEATEMMAGVEAALKKARLIEVRFAKSEEERQDLWRMRRSVSPSLARIAPWKINEDVCVPRSNLPLLVDAVTGLAEKYRLRVPTFGHAGDGNLHVNVMFDRRNRDEARRAEALVAELFEATLSLSGSISGEHGIGFTKMQYLPTQLGRDALEFEQRIKQAFDPLALINPGKVIGQT